MVHPAMHGSGFGSPRSDSGLSQSSPRPCLSLESTKKYFKFNYLKYMGLPGGSVVKTPFFQCREHRFNPWSGNRDPTCPTMWPKYIPICYFFSFGCTLRHTESLFPDQGSDTYPLHWKHGVLTLDHQGDPCIYNTSQFTWFKVIYRQNS